MPKLRNKLYGLMQFDNRGQRLVAQVLCTNRARAVELFNEHYEFDEGSVVQLGSLDLLYVKAMRPEEVYLMEYK